MTETADSFILPFAWNLAHKIWNIYLCFHEEKKKNQNSPGFLGSKLQKKNEGVESIFLKAEMGEKGWQKNNLCI